MDDRLHDRHLHSLLARFQRWERERPDAVFLRQPYGDSWHEVTYAQAGATARRLAGALRSLGLRVGDHVGILSKNCYHWIITDLALMLGGFVSVPFYASLPAAALREVIELSDIKALFIGKLDAWDDAKTAAVPEDVQTIAFPTYAGNAVVTADYRWDDLLASATPLDETPPVDLDAIWTILFTSGTTGTPKGVIHTHRNPALVLRIEEITDFTGTLRLKRKKWFSFLPLNHVAERIGVLANCLANGGSISFAESIDTFAANLRSVQPSFLFAVPRIWTKFYQAVTAKVPAPLLNRLLRLPLAGPLLGGFLRKQMGLAHVEIAGTGAAITPAYLKDWYRLLGIHLIEAYGMTEVCGSICNGPQADAPPDSVGSAVPFCDVKIDAATGEILMRAPYQMTGYYRAPAKTREVLRDGWIHSGDRGTLDVRGYVRVIGRISDAFKTSKGQFVVPNPLEERLAENEHLEQICVVGLGCPQPLALARLAAGAAQAARTSIEASLSATLARLNAGLPAYAKIATLVIDDTEWTEHNHLLTPTQKVRRGALDAKYAARYEQWLARAEPVIWLGSHGST